MAHLAARISFSAFFFFGFFLSFSRPQGIPMAYLAPAEFVTKMVDAGESKISCPPATRSSAPTWPAPSWRWPLVRRHHHRQHRQPLVGAMLFPVGFCMLYLLGFDLLTGVFTLAPLAVIDKRPGATWAGVLRNWGLVFVGNFAGAFTVAVMMAIVFTFGFSEPNGRQEPARPHRRRPHAGLRRTTAPPAC
jgi:hypothetical protein